MAEIRRLFSIKDPDYCRIPDEDTPLPPGCSSPVELSALVISQPVVPPAAVVVQALFRPITENMGQVADKIAQALVPYGLDYEAENVDGVLLRIKTQEIYKALPSNIGEDIDTRVHLAVIEYLNESIKAIPHQGLSENDVYIVADHLVDDPADYQVAMRTSKPLNLILEELKRPVEDVAPVQPVKDVMAEAYAQAFEPSYPVPPTNLSPGNYTSDHLRKAAGAMGLPFDEKDDATSEIRVAIWERYKFFGNMAGTVTDKNIEDIAECAARSVLRARLYAQFRAKGLSSDQIAENIPPAMEAIIAAHQPDTPKPKLALQ